MTRPRLSRATLEALPWTVAQPRHDRRALAPGVVHFGPGAFFRAHQAVYFDDLLAADPHWGVAAVALRSAEVRDALAPQDWLYTLAIRDARSALRVVGSLDRVLAAPAAPDQVAALLAAPSTRLVTLTVTEKGYCLGGDGTLDFDHPDIRRDLTGDAPPVSAIGWLVDGLRRRRAAGTVPFTALSCDNLSGNGSKLRDAVVAFARAQDPDLAAWIAGEGAFPCSMVDSITPASDDALRAEVATALGVVDDWPIQRESFTQWVVEDRFVGAAPDLAAVGATLARDVAPFEHAKLRLLNGAHSTLAYLGLLRGRESVGEAMADPALARFVERLMREDIRPTLPPTPGLDLDRYIADVLGRFRNPAIRHLLSQIAWDGSKKLPIRLLGTLADRADAGAPVGRIALAVAAWMRFVVRQAKGGVALVDPLADRLAGVGRDCEGGRDAVDRFLALDAVFPARIAADPALRAALARAYDALAPDVLHGDLP